MNKGTLLLFLFLVACTSLSARLGETEPELVERFGKIILRGKERIAAQGRANEIGVTLSFKSDQWTVHAVLIDGRCERIRYSKSGAWTDEQLTYLLRQNYSSYPWRETSGKYRKSKRDWVRDDGAIATWNAFGLKITSRSYEQTVKSAEGEAATRSKQLPNF
jgi:hypothetical protein